MANKVSTGTMSVVIVAILTGLVGAYAVRTVLVRETPAPPRPSAPERVLVPLASADLPAGRTITFGDVALTRLTRDEMRERGMPTDLMMLSSQQVIGRRLRSEVRRGQPFLTTDLYLQGTGPTVVEKLKPGYRAVSIQLPYIRAGSAIAGTTVDVLFRTFPRGARPGVAGIPEATFSLFEGAEVLQVASAGGSPVVTLAVTPEQAQILNAVEGRGQISLVARPSSDTLTFGVVYRDRLTLERLLNIEAPPLPQGPYTTEVYRRLDKSVHAFPADDLEVEEERYAGEPATPTVPASIPGRPVKVSSTPNVPALIP